MENKAPLDKEHVRFCPHCKIETRGELAPHHFHYGIFRCYKCGKTHFPPKPETDPTKYKREKSHTDLVKKFSKGFCEMCLRDEATIKKRTSEGLDAHHVIPYQYGGEPTRENIWILCTCCHKQIEHYRRYYNDGVSIKIFIEAFMAKQKQDTAA